MGLDKLTLNGYDYWTARASLSRRLGGGMLWSTLRQWTIDVVLDTTADRTALIAAWNAGPVTMTLPDGETATVIVGATSIGVPRFPATVGITLTEVRS